MQAITIDNLSEVAHENMHDVGRIQQTIVERMRDISSANLCAFLSPSLQAAYAIGWVPPPLHEMLLHYFMRPGVSQTAPLMLERPGNMYTYEYLHCLPDSIMSCFVLPIVGSSSHTPSTSAQADSSRLFGLIAGAYHTSEPMREEIVPLLQVLAGQAGSVLENMRLVAQVTEARTEARKLLKRVLDDQRFKTSILESIPSGVILLDRQGCITTYNASAHAILGYDAEEVRGQKIGHLLPMHALPSHSELESAATRESDAIQHEVVHTRRKNGAALVLDVSSVMLRSNRGREIGVLITFSDITAIHRLEEEKRTLDRLASLGQMSANVAHEVRNPLASIKMSLQVLLRESDELLTGKNLPERVADMKESVTIALDEVDRLDGLVRELLLFAKPRQIYRASTDICAIIDRVLHLLHDQAEAKDIQFEHVYQDVPLVSLDASQIEQVLLNVCTNALQSMSKGGELHVGVSTVPNAENTPVSIPLQLSLPLQGAQTSQDCCSYVVVTVQDTGCGIAPDQLPQVGQPFFTTKAHGMGLGMAISKRLVEEHHGWLDIQSQVGTGTTVSMYLPIEAL